jgi:prefoldin alpha subunit
MESEVIHLGQLNFNQLYNLKGRIGNKVNSLSATAVETKTIANKLKEYVYLLEELEARSDKQVLIPFSKYLQVVGTLSEPDKVLVDIGTGYHVQKVIGVLV